MVLELGPQQPSDLSEPENGNGRIPMSWRRLPMPIELVRGLWYGSSLPDHYMVQNPDDLPSVESDVENVETTEPSLDVNETEG